MIFHVLRGELYYADLEPAVGSEQGGIRPVLIIQNDIGNAYSPTTIVAALTTRYENKHSIPTHYYAHARAGLSKDSIILLEQVHCIDKSRLLTKIGKLSDKEMQFIDSKLRISLALQ
jgi:mRNA interferase MazF